MAVFVWFRLIELTAGSAKEVRMLTPTCSEREGSLDKDPRLSYTCAHLIADTAEGGPLPPPPSVEQSNASGPGDISTESR